VEVVAPEQVAITDGQSVVDNHGPLLPPAHFLKAVIDNQKE
jgi:hypothetical protein